MNILVIDDDNDFSEFFKLLLLKRYKCNVFTASNGLIGYELLLREPIDLIFLDLNMPEMNGVEFLKVLKTKGINVNIVILSGYLEEYYDNDMNLFENRECLGKPFDIQQLDHLMKNYSISRNE